MFSPSTRITAAAGLSPDTGRRVKRVVAKYRQGGLFASPKKTVSRKKASPFDSSQRSILTMFSSTKTGKVQTTPTKKDVDLMTSLAASLHRYGTKNKPNLRVEKLLAAMGHKPTLKGHRIEGMPARVSYEDVDLRDTTLSGSAMFCDEFGDYPPEKAKGLWTGLTIDKAAFGVEFIRGHRKRYTRTQVPKEGLPSAALSGEYGIVVPPEVKEEWTKQRDGKNYMGDREEAVAPKPVTDPKFTRFLPQGYQPPKPLVAESYEDMLERTAKAVKRSRDERELQEQADEDERVHDEFMAAAAADENNPERENKRYRVDDSSSDDVESTGLQDPFSPSPLMPRKLF